MKRRALLPLAALLVVGLACAGYLFCRRTAWPRALAGLGLARSAAAGVAASGFIEAEEFSIAPEVGARIAAVEVAEGDEVEAGQVLVRLDDRLAQAQAEVARAGWEVAQAELALIRSGARPEKIREAQATLARAEALRDGAYQAWQDALAILDNPQELNAQVVLAETQVNVSQAALAQALALKDVAQIAQDQYEAMVQELDNKRRELENIPPPLRPPLPEMPLELRLVPYLYWKAWAQVNAAGATYDTARQTLDLLYHMANDPEHLQAQADAARAQYHAAQAAVDLARAQVDGVRAGPTDEELAVAEAQVEQAQAQLESAQVVLDKLTLTSPVGGWVLEVTGHPGELAVPGVPLITLADLEQVTLAIYVPENRLGQAQIGQRVEVRVDSFPDRVFIGRVASIASQAEFTPRNVQTAEERVNMVFAVKVVIPNPDHALKPGMPADAVILTQEP